MKHLFSIYKQYIRISFNMAAAYRANFFLTLFISLLGNLLVPLLTVLIYSSGASIPGWSFHEALLIQAVFMLCTGVCSPIFFNMVWITMDHVREGSYDMLMLKPGSTIFITVASSFDLENTGALIGGVVMFVYALSGIQSPPLSGWLNFGLLFFMGVCFLLGCTLLMTATAFKWVGNSRIFEIFDAITTFGRYPATIYGKLLGIVTSYILPVAMLGFFPASALLEPVAPAVYLVCVPCVLFVLFGWAAFKRMIYLYQSAGG